MPMIGTIGKPVIVDIEPNFAIKNVALIKFKDSSRVLNAYVRALLMSDYFEDAVLSKVRGGTQKFICYVCKSSRQIKSCRTEVLGRSAAFV